jgi:hypothetical protein
MPPKNQNQNSSTLLTTGGFANMIVLVIFLLTIGGAVLYFKNFPLTKMPVVQPTEQPQAVVEKEVATNGIPQESSEFSSWQTYKHTEYAYEIKYPQGMKVTEKPKFTFVFLVPLSGYKYDGIQIWSTTQHTGIVPEPDFQASSFQEVLAYVEKEIATNQSYENVTKKVTTLNGYEAIYLLPKEGGGVSGDVFVFHKPHVLHIDYTYPYNADKRESYKMTEKILSTLKFIE